ncbi:peptidase C69 [bacterium (candidate division B38) B3_B38]|nr:MAG: peptidase C69 [bacterium (candidate division B38) B3_B38]
MILTETEAKAILEKLISYSTADEMVAVLTGGSRGFSRFANNAMTQNVDKRGFSLNVNVAFGKKEGSSTINKFDDASLKGAVKRAESIARLLPANPEHMPPLPSQKYQKIEAYFPETAEFGPIDRAKEILKVIQTCDQKELITAGTFSNGDGFTGIANSKGLFGYHKSTSCGFSVSVRTQDRTGSGRAQQSNERKIGDINPSPLAAEAIRTAEMSRNPHPKEPGDYTVILKPTAMMELFIYLLFGLSARSADEGRSFLSDRRTGGNKLGQKIFGENITIRSAATHPKLLGTPFGGDGLPARDITWVEKGVVKNLSYSRYWAAKKGKEPTFAMNFLMEGGDHTIEELIKDTDKGILVSSFWYIRMVDPNNLLCTGLTRDGTFWVENGKIQYPINNVRFNESPVVLLNNIEKMTKPQKVGFGIMPGVKAHNFTLSSVSEAV